ncbi:phosphatase PAP2 family protein [Treponema zioleckii]|uniref:phosphatase PAP2 family protein n=1 Tax=Treponema zioleckii TaxID=331680 RepID=UPI00168B31C7|nr:phosphatase PAP2 family protein [Treponema zioleckii]
MKKILTSIFIFIISSFIFAEAIFKLNPVEDGILFGGGVLLSGSDLILDNALEINRQKYEGETYDKNDVNSLDRFFMHQYSKSRDTAADCTLVASMAAPLVLLATDKDTWFTNAVMYAETMLIANGIKELTKLAVTRIRPYMYYDPSTHPEDDVKEGDFANSFPSGHSTMAFAGATFASYTFCKYFPNSPWKVPVIAGSYGLALTTAILRMSSGNHFFTDVVTGAAIGTGAGFLVPWLHKVNSQNDDVKLSVMPTGFYLTFYF